MNKTIENNYEKELQKDYAEFYNSDLKNRYLNTIDNEGTRQNIAYTFKKTAKIESEKGKDLCQFNFEDIDELFRSFRTKSFAAINTKASICSKYIDFCVEIGFADVNYNWIKNNFFGEDNLKKYVSKVAINKKILTREDLKNMMNICANAQDKVPIALLPEGIKGRPIKEFSYEELRNLKMSDCNTDTNYITATKDNGETRLVKVPQKTMDILVEAYNQTSYLKNNGVSTAKHKEVELYDSQYVLKEADRANTITDDSRVSAQLINRRIKNVAKWYGNKFITPNNLYLSGMVDYAKQIKAEKGELEKEDYEEICKKYDKNPVYWHKLKSEIKDYI
jgi:integrase